MTEYHCNECDDEVPFVVTCKLILPQCAAEPTVCPIFGDSDSCNWREQ